jgi:hypothetical protein
MIVADKWEITQRSKSQQLPARTKKNYVLQENSGVVLVLNTGLFKQKYTL